LPVNYEFRRFYNYITPWVVSLYGWIFASMNNQNKNLSPFVLRCEGERLDTTGLGEYWWRCGESNSGPEKIPH